MAEGSLEAPTRHPVPWQDPEFYDRDKIDAEMRRVFDICHGCRRCFNLCDSFPRLFDLIDESETGELNSVASKDFKPVVDACTLCDMCFMTKCPYVPPHEFALDFPHLMLRYRAAEHREGKTGFFDAQLAKTDRNGKLASRVAPLANWATRTGNAATRPAMEAIAGIDKRADLPEYQAQTFDGLAKKTTPEVNTDAPAHGRKAVIYTTCFANYNHTQTAIAARAVLAKNGVETEVIYPECCGMPQLEQGDIADVAARAKRVAAELRPWVDKGHAVIALTPSCALMLKFEWPLLVTDDENIEKLSEATFDIPQYVVDISKDEGLADGLTALDGGVTLHISCHSRAQNMGQKAAEMLRLIPDVDLAVIERCSGHGGTWGVKKEFYDVALKVGKPVARQAVKAGKMYVASECPLAGMHILQGMKEVEKASVKIEHSPHPVELIARAYGIGA